MNVYYVTCLILEKIKMADAERIVMLETCLQYNPTCFQYQFRIVTTVAWIVILHSRKQITDVYKRQGDVGRTAGKRVFSFH